MGYCATAQHTHIAPLAGAHAPAESAAQYRSYSNKKYVRIILVGIGGRYIFALQNLYNMEKTQTLNANTIKHTDVTGKVLYYLAVSNGERTEFINIGQGTFERISKLKPETVNEVNHSEQNEQTALLETTEEVDKPKRKR